MRSGTEVGSLSRGDPTQPPFQKVAWAPPLILFSQLVSCSAYLISCPPRTSRSCYCFIQQSCRLRIREVKTFVQDGTAAKCREGMGTQVCLVLPGPQSTSLLSHQNIDIYSEQWLGDSVCARVYMCICVHVYACVHACACVCARANMCLYVHMCIRVYACARVYIVHTRVCICVHMCIRARTRALVTFVSHG